MKPIVTLAVVLAIGGLAIGGAYVAPEYFRPGTATLLLAACPYEDQTGGFGGQAGTCQWSCSIGEAELLVRADDGDATVSGSGACSGKALLSCAGQKECDDQHSVTKSGEGACKGQSDEFWDSGFYLSCGMLDLEDPPVDPGPVPPREFCPVVIRPSPPYPRICVDPVIGDAIWQECYTWTAWSCSFEVDMCQIAWTEECHVQEDESGAQTTSSRFAPSPFHPCQVTYGTRGDTLCQMAMSKDGRRRAMENITRYVFENFDAANTTSSAHFFNFEGFGVGLVCKGQDCLQKTPVCLPAHGGARVECSIQ